MKYFNNCSTTDQAKNEFRKLCKLLHPDTSGYNSQKEFVQMYTEFKEFKPSDGGTIDDNFYNFVQNFEHLKGIKIEFVGTFIYLCNEVEVQNYKEGATYLQKDALKAIKLDGYKPCLYSNKHKKWYFAPANYKQKFKGKKSFNELADTYGYKAHTNKQTFIRA